MAPEPTIVVTLPDGRGLAADDVGDPAGAPVLYLHGAPDCRLARHPDDAIAGELGVRLIAVDRPGYGASDPQPAPDVRTWAADVAVLLDVLEVDRCALAAWSAGAPWAFGLAAELDERVDRLVTYGCLAPFEALEPSDVAPDVADASGNRAHVAADVIAGLDVAELAEGFAAVLIPPAPVDLDLARELVLENDTEWARAELASVPGAVDQLARSLATAVEHHGGAGLTADLAVQYAPGLLGVLAEVPCPVTLVHGQHDPIAGPAVGRWMAARLASATVEVWDRGHRGLLVEWARWLGVAVAVTPG